jgi:phosphoenolpyruvate carboxylase
LSLCFLVDRWTAFISAKDKDANPVNESLRSNVRLLGDSLGRTLAHDLGEDFLAQVETVRTYAKRQDNGVKLHEYLRSLPDDRLLPVARAFNQFLQLANIAEQHHRVHSKCIDDDSRTAADRMQLIDVFQRVQQERPDAKRLLFDTFAKMRIELVLTAHPTETIRRTLIQKYDSIEECLGILEMFNPDAEEKSIAETAQRTRERLRELIAQAWHTDEFRHERPSPVDGNIERDESILSTCRFILLEARWGFAVIENSLWQAVPTFFRDLDHLLLDTVGERMPLHAAPIRFASWMGGDRDVCSTCSSPSDRSSNYF